MMSFVLLFIFTYASGYGLGKIDKKFLYYCALLAFVGISFHYWDEEGLLQAIIAFVVSILGFFIGVGKTINSHGNGGADYNHSDIPDYWNWDRIYDSLCDSESQHVIATTKEEAIKHFRSDYSKSKHIFEENESLRTISSYETDFLFGFFSQFEYVIDNAEFIKRGENGECYLKYKDWTYHHWPYRTNTDLDISMRRGEIRRGNSFLRYGLSSGGPACQYWITNDNGRDLVGFNSVKGIMEKRLL